MSVTPMASYVGDNLYSRINLSTVATETTGDEKTNQTKEDRSASEDRVTFSAGLSLAQTRESIGLNPTGILKLKDLENVVQDRKDFVSATLTQTVQRLGIKLDQEISLSMDSKNNIIISGDFPEKSELEHVLSENENFTTAFKQLSANQSILDQISQLQNNVKNIQANIIGYFSSDTDFNNLLALADEYESLKDSDNKMKSFLDLSCAQHPYSYIFDKNDSF